MLNTAPSRNLQLHNSHLRVEIGSKHGDHNTHETFFTSVQAYGDRHFDLRRVARGGVEEKEVLWNSVVISWHMLEQCAIYLPVAESKQ